MAGARDKGEQPSLTVFFDKCTAGNSREVTGGQSVEDLADVRDLHFHL